MMDSYIIRTVLLAQIKYLPKSERNVICDLLIYTKKIKQHRVTFVSDLSDPQFNVRCYKRKGLRMLLLIIYKVCMVIYIFDYSCF